ncbi:uncharacterized protein LOC106161021 [Lingula anatina]|uniref:Uncharacterized protein LOC106161021 n=1 Tax=Lingula anatina TaxID=7574 RepID=A0A1S3I4V9_LINAN|nr:uncharacterized protein LOC106161021 [Lingula anatina]|eukprot:XP_013393302.1 uncharacterized protein LOC106161021 [Lingula anatina]
MAPYTILFALLCNHIAHAHWSPAAHEIIDMTYVMSEDSLVWPGFNMKFHYTRIRRDQWKYGAGWLEDNDICRPEHQGTHLDAPAHFARGKWHVQDIPPYRFFGPAIKVDISAKAALNRDYNLEVKDVENWERANGKIPDGAILFVYTGWGKYHTNSSAYYGYDGAGDWKNDLHFPSVSQSAAKWLAENRKISAVGVDSPSIGPSSSYMAHVPLHEKNIFNAESVANLDKLPTKGYSVAMLPVNIKDGSGAPLRIIAFKTVQISPGPEDVVDLTYPLGNNTVMWPGRASFKLLPVQKGYMKIGNNSVWVDFNNFCSPEHAGTHLDAPAHFIKGSWRIHQIPAHTLIGPAIRVDISKKAANNPDAVLTVQDLHDWEYENGRIPDNAMVFLYSGWGKYVDDYEKYLGTANRTHWENDQGQSLLHVPGFSGEAAEWLVNNRKIIGVGSDTISYDAGQTTSFPAHVTFLRAKRLALEIVANLDKLPPSGYTAFVFHMLHVDGSGAPTRLVAVKNSAISFNSDEVASDGPMSRPLFAILLLPSFCVLIVLL